MNLELSFEQLAVFSGAAAIVVAAPGPDNLGTLAIGLSRGRTAAMGFATGCALGCLTHTLWAVLGVSAIIAASEVAFTIIKAAGAIYLVYLGIVMLLKTPSDQKNQDARDTTMSNYLMRGLLSNAMNPKVAIFFFAFLPQFIRPGSSAGLQILVLGIIFTILTAIAFNLIGYFSSPIGQWLRAKSWMNRFLDRATGCLFITLGLRLAMTRRQL